MLEELVMKKHGRGSCVRLRNLCLFLIGLILFGKGYFPALGSFPQDTHSSQNPRIQVIARHGESLRATLDGLRLLKLRGTHRERGLAHGFLMAPEIVEMFNRMLPMVQQFFQGKDYQKVLIPLAHRFTWPKRYEGEMAGMLEGIRLALPKKEDRMLKILEREIGTEDLRFLNSFPDFGGFNCSSFSAWGKLTPDGEIAVARNLDFYFGQFSNSIPFCILAQEPAEEGLRTTIDISIAGLMGATTVLNEDGIFCAIHDESGLKAESKSFVSRFLGLRDAVEQARGSHAVEDLCGILRKNPTVFGANVHVAVPLNKEGDEVLPVILEWDGNGKDQGVTIRSVKPGESPCALFCTNHYRSRTTRFTRCERYAKLREAAASHLVEGKFLSPEDMKKILDSVAPSGFVVTLYSVIAWPKTKRMAIALSPAPLTPATKGRWIEFTWEEIFSNL